MRRETAIAAIGAALIGWSFISRGLAEIFPPEPVWWISAGLLSLAVSAFLANTLEK